MPVIVKYLMVNLRCKILQEVIIRLQKKFLNLHLFCMKFCICGKGEKRLSICSETGAYYYFDKEKEKITRKNFNNKLSWHNTSKSLVCYFPLSMNLYISYFLSN